MLFLSLSILSLLNFLVLYLLNISVYIYLTKCLWFFILCIVFYIVPDFQSKRKNIYTAYLPSLSYIWVRSIPAPTWPGAFLSFHPFAVSCARRMCISLTRNSNDFFVFHVQASLVFLMLNGLAMFCLWSMYSPLKECPHSVQRYI